MIKHRETREHQHPGEQSPPSTCIGLPMRPGPLKVLSCGAAEVFGVSVEVAGTDPLAALMNSSTSKCLPKMFSSSSILAAGVEERSPPNWKRFQRYENGRFPSQQCLHEGLPWPCTCQKDMLPGHLSGKDPRHLPLTGDMCECWHLSTGPS